MRGYKRWRGATAVRLCRRVVQNGGWGKNNAPGSDTCAGIRTQRVGDPKLGPMR